MKKIKSPEVKEPTFIDFIEMLKSKNRLLYKLSITMILLLIFIFLTLLYISDVISFKNTNFRNDLIILSKYLKEKEIKSLQADWVLMKSKDDFNKIYEKIESYYTKFNLGKPRIKR